MSIHASSGARALSYQDLQTLCNVNHQDRVAFLAVLGPRENEVVIGSGCYFLNPTTNLAEVAFMVAPEWQGQGIGTALQARLQEYAMAHRVRGFIAEILPGNERMVRLAANAAGAATTERDEDSLQVTILFGEPAKATNEVKAAPKEKAETKPSAPATKRKSRKPGKT